MTYRDSRWQRKSDKAVIRIEADPQAFTGGGCRHLRAVNEATNRSFWVTPEGLARKYIEIGGEQ